MLRLSVSQALTRACALAQGGSRRLLGLAGEPGAGKSTLSARIAQRCPGDSVVVPMDGFHLAHSELERLGRAARKGAPDTFDAWGFLALVQRLAADDEPVVYAPQYRRELHNGVAGAVPVPRRTPLVVVEGNYLLLDEPPWASLRALFDEIWFVEVDERTRLDRLVARHVQFGKSRQEALAWSHGPDQANAELIAATRARADAVVEMD